MKAVVCSDFGSAQLKDIPRPDPRQGEVVLKVRRVQLSVTECRLFRGEKIAHYETVARRLKDGEARVFGHEFCGEVVDVGPDVRGMEVGDRVYAPGKLPCGSCAYCGRGFAQYCENKRGIGYDIPGALAEYVRLPVGPLRVLPNGVSDTAATALQPVASALLCTLEGAIEPGDVVATVGAGVMGYACGQFALQFGAQSVFAADVMAEKRSLAADVGMIPVDARASGLPNVVREANGGIGADVVFEAVGGDQSHGTAGDDPLAVAVRTARKGGSVVQVGHIGGDLTLTPRELRLRNVDWINPGRGTKQLGPNADSGELTSALVAGGRIDVESFVTIELGGLEAFDEAIEVGLNPRDHGALGPAQLVL